MHWWKHWWNHFTFVDVTIKHAGETAAVDSRPTLDAKSNFCGSIISGGVDNSAGTCQWLHLLLCVCPLWVEGSGLPSTESNKVTRLKARVQRGSKISNKSGAEKGCRFSIRAEKNEHHRHVWRSFFHRIFPFDDTFMKNVCIRQHKGVQQTRTSDLCSIY